MSNALAFRDVTFDVRTIRNTTYITSAQLAAALGYATENAVTKIYHRNADEFTVEMTVTQNGSGGQLPTRLFSLRGAHLVAMFARTPVAKDFRKWILDVLDKETKAAVNLLDKDYFAKVRDIAIKFADDWVRVGKGEDIHPSLTIPDEVLAGIIAQQISRHNFRLYVDYAGQLHVAPIPNKSPYEGLAEAISDPGNIGLPDELIEEIGAACVKALAYRAHYRKSVIGKMRGAK
nr:MAG TPA: antirepressor [Caudoviricetes sp.]